MYEANKIQSVKNAAEQIEEYIDDDNYSEMLFQTSLESDVCIRVLSDDLNLAAGNMGCALYRMDKNTIDHYIRLAKENDDEFLDLDRVFRPNRKENNEIREVVLTKIIEKDDDDDEDIVLMVNTNITPIDATTNTLKTQIIYISIITAILILLLALFLNRNIVTPLIKINQAAKSLSGGEYSIDESTNRYKEAHELNSTLKQASIDIQAADQAKRDLIANVSHDLRTPLTMIGGYGEMMRDLPGEKTDENIQVIIDESYRLKNLVNDLLDLSKLQEKKIELHRSSFDLCSLIHRELKKYEVYRTNEGFIFNVDCPDKMIVNADEARIEQVFNNFMSNAINYSTGKNQIDIRLHQVDDFAYLEVQDYGEGIREDRLPYIWDRYYKIDKEHTRSSTGSGLGLAIVKQIFELHDVPFGVISKEKEGSTFWFKLPLVKEDNPKE